MQKNYIWSEIYITYTWKNASIFVMFSDNCISDLHSLSISSRMHMWQSNNRILHIPFHQLSQTESKMYYLPRLDIQLHSALYIFAPLDLCEVMRTVKHNTRPDSLKPKSTSTTHYSHTYVFTFFWRNHCWCLQAHVACLRNASTNHIWTFFA